MRLARPATLAFAIVALSATARADPVRWLTADDVDPAAANTTGVTVSPLYGGSDRTRIDFAWRAEGTGRQSVPVLALDPGPPADRPATLVIRATVTPDLRGEHSGNVTYSPSAPTPAVTFTIDGVDGSVTVPCGRWTGGGCPSLVDYSLAVRVPPGRLPRRLAVRATISEPADLTIRLDGCRWVVGDVAAAPLPTPVPTSRPAVDWPPPDAVVRPVRVFAGDDFDGHVASPRQNVENGPVYLRLGTNNTGTATSVAAAVNERSAQGPRTLPLVAMEDPGVSAPFAVVGDVAWAGVSDASDLDGYAYLELVAEYADGRRVASTTTADTGPARLLRGRSGPRPFAVPVFDGPGKPTRIRVNLVTSGTGSVTIDGLQLVQAEPPEPGKARLVASGLGDDGKVHLTVGQWATLRTDGEVNWSSNGNVAGVVSSTPGGVVVAGIEPGATTVVLAQETGSGQVSQAIEVDVTPSTATTGPATQAADVPPPPAVPWDALKDPAVWAANADAEAARVAYNHAAAVYMPNHPVMRSAAQALANADRRLADSVGRYEAARRAVPRPWWARAGAAETAAGLVGLIGLVGLAEPWVRRGRARAAVLAILVVVAVGGQGYVAWAMLVAGRGEPPRAWVPLLGAGAVALAVAASAVPRVNRRYRDAELRRMRAIDAG